MYLIPAYYVIYYGLIPINKFKAGDKMTEELVLYFLRK